MESEEHDNIIGRRPRIRRLRRLRGKGEMDSEEHDNIIARRPSIRRRRRHRGFSPPPLSPPPLKISVSYNWTGTSDEINWAVPPTPPPTPTATTDSATEEINSVDPPTFTATTDSATAKINSTNTTTATALTESGTDPAEINSADPPTPLTEIDSATGSTGIFTSAGADPPTALTGTERHATGPVGINSVNPHTVTTERAIAPAGIQLVNQPTGTESSQDQLKHIFMIAQPLALAALPVTLLGLAPPRQSIKPKLIFPYNAFLVLIFLSIVTSIGVTIYSIIKSTRSRDFARHYKNLMIIATVSFLLGAVFWLFLKFPIINIGICFIAIVIVITVSLWYSRRKATKSSQTGQSSEVLRPPV